MQDLTIAGWGWVGGLSFQAMCGSRTQIGGGGSTGFLFPRGDDHLEIWMRTRSSIVTRGAGASGRQWITGGLGAYAFDGADGVVAA